MNYFQKLKLKWEVNSNFQLLIILVVFAVAGSTTLFVKRPIFKWLALDSEDPVLLRIGVYLITVIPAYFILLLVIGTLAGQYKFFWTFEKRLFGSIIRGSKQ